MKRVRSVTLIRTAAGLFFAGSLLLAAAAGLGAAQYIDLRRIEPIHGSAANGAQKAALCLACHGANGVSTAPTFPRIAGQRPDYLYHRLVSFKKASKQDPYYSVSPMTPIAAALSDGDMRDLAAYFSAQVPQPPAPATASNTGRGESLFRGGDPSRGIPSCQGCHGAEANGPLVRTEQYAAYPSLRGQYAPYLISRLTNFQKGLPNGTSNDFVMAGVARNLDDEAIQAIAAYLSSLPPTAAP